MAKKKPTNADTKNKKPAATKNETPAAPKRTLALSAASAPRWGALNLSAKAELPPPGTYPAVIRDVTLTDKGDVLWLAVDYELNGTNARPRGDLGAIAAVPTSPHAHRVSDGLRLLQRLSQATGVDLDGVDPDRLPGLLIGKQVMLTLAHKIRDGQPDLVVREIRPPA
jgi:hypothetical protein